MSPRSILLLVSFLLVGYTISAQYTEKINSNRPGTSQGAFSVGNNVLQFEGGLGLGKRKHDILNTKTSSFTIDYTARYGLLIEQLEIRANGRFRSDAVKFRIGANEEKLNQTNFELNTLGAKYLIYDPYKRPKEKDSVDLEDLKSWRRTHRFRWKSLIPAVSAYAGVNFDTKDNPFISPGQEGISPKVVIATQNNWNSRLSGDWVLVTNLIFDRIATDDMIIGWIITSTHTINDNWAVFGELQGQKSDFYSDNLLRLGGAYLLSKDLQLDANIAFNFKDTPSVFNFSVGASYRFDWHSKDEIIEQPGLEKGIKDHEKELDDDKEGDENEDGIELDELEEIESDSLKQGKTPFINDFEDDSFRDELERDLDERRTAERLERERIEAEKLAKKEDKKFQKEERRRLKREAKEARAAEKAKIKEEKEKAKMIEDIDAELDKIEQDDGIDNELQKLEEELKKLEAEENKDQQPTEEQKAKEAEEKKAEEDQKVDEEYEKLQEEQEKAKKAEEKSKKEEEKRKRKEEKKRQKEEKRRKKEEEKRKKQEDQDQG